MPPRGDPYYEIWKQTAIRVGPRGGESVRTGFLEHREISELYEYNLDMDEQEKREFWADYSHFMVSNRFKGVRNDVLSNPFWNNWGINPDHFDWHGWRQAMGYPEGNRR